MDNNKEYFAFISYKREDEKWAVWLQNKLEHYKLPSNMNGRTDLPKEIRPIFRDKSELAGGVLDAVILAAPADLPFHKCQSVLDDKAEAGFGQAGQLPVFLGP